MREYIFKLLLSLPGALFAFTIRGYAQALTATKLGDPTPRNSGRLTMNPLVHLDPIGFLFILLFGFGWTKSVPVNTRNFKRIKRDNAIFILSGPIGCMLGSFLMCFLTYLVYALIGWFPALNAGVAIIVAQIFFYAASLCMFLGFFYLIPLPGFDGYNLIANFVPYQYYRKLYNLERYSMYIFIGFIILLQVPGVQNVLFWPANQLLNLFRRFWALILL